MSFHLLLVLSPVLVVSLGGLLLMIAEAFSKHGEEGDERHSGPSSELALGTAITLLVGAAFAAGLWMAGPDVLASAKALAPHLAVDRFSLFFSFVVCLGGAFSALLAGGYLPEHKLDRGEFYPLITFSTVGAMVLASATDLLTMFIGLETLSLGVYAMTGFRRGSPRSAEAAVKYFLLGSFAAALLVYGGALLYGATGHTDFVGIRDAVSKMNYSDNGNIVLVIASAILILAGLAFKVGAVPFHMWTPDAYEGAPTAATTYMAIAVKSAAVALLMRVLLQPFGTPEWMSWGSGWPPALALMAVLSMVVSNFTAGRQESVKRMLAYSSIAHAGYVLVGLVATMRMSEEGQGSVMFYLLGYTVSSAGALGALILCGSRGKEATSFEDLAGLAKRNPAVAAVFSLFLLSLAGVPPTVGFFGKFYIVKAAIGAGLIPLAIILVLNSVIAAYYYLKVLVYMYMREPAPGSPIAKPMQSGYVNAAIILAAVLVVALGMWPTKSIELATLAAIVR